MATVKKTVTLDSRVAAEAAELAGESFSSFVNDAVARQVQQAKLERLVAADQAERGVLDPAAVTDAAAELRALHAEIAAATDTRAHGEEEIVDSEVVGDAVDPDTTFIGRGVGGRGREPVPVDAIPYKLSADALADAVAAELLDDSGQFRQDADARKTIAEALARIESQLVSVGGVFATGRGTR